MWVKFLRRFDFDPPEKKGRVTISYRAGSTYFVRKICGVRAISLGMAIAVERPAR